MGLKVPARFWCCFDISNGSGSKVVNEDLRGFRDKEIYTTQDPGGWSERVCRPLLTGSTNTSPRSRGARSELGGGLEPDPGPSPELLPGLVWRQIKV